MTVINDPTENIRREMVAEINVEPCSREGLESKYGKVWDTDELQADFTVVAFFAPFALVVRKSDGAKGTFQFQHVPRFYFGFTVEN